MDFNFEKAKRYPSKGLIGLGQVERQPKSNPNIKYINLNKIQPDFQPVKLNLNRNYETRVDIMLIRLGEVAIKHLLNYKNYWTTLYELQND